MDRIKERIEYLKTEISHAGYWDGWSVEGMKEEKEWLDQELKKLVDMDKKNV